jgi:trk system potassium uptake protein TrkA
MKKQAMVIGLGRFGTSLATSLGRLGYEVLAVDIDQRRTEAISSEVTHAAQADATSEEALKDLDAGSFDVAIVAIGSATESSVLSTILLKDFKIPYIIARANNELHGKILTRIGADTVVYPEMDAGRRLAHLVRARNVVEYVPIAKNFGVSKITAPQYLAGHKLSDIGFDKKSGRGVTLVLLQRGDDIILNPKMSEVLRGEETLIVAGQDDDLDQLLLKANEKYGEKQEKVE